MPLEWRYGLIFHFHFLSTQSVALLLRSFTVNELLHFCAGRKAKLLGSKELEETAVVYCSFCYLNLKPETTYAKTPRKRHFALKNMEHVCSERSAIWRGNDPHFMSFQRHKPLFSLRISPIHPRPLYGSTHTCFLGSQIHSYGSRVRYYLLWFKQHCPARNSSVQNL